MKKCIKVKQSPCKTCSMQNILKLLKHTICNQTLVFLVLFHITISINLCMSEVNHFLPDPGHHLGHHRLSSQHVPLGPHIPCLVCTLQHHALHLEQHHTLVLEVRLLVDSYIKVFLHQFYLSGNRKTKVSLVNINVQTLRSFINLQIESRDSYNPKESKWKQPKSRQNRKQNTHAAISNW